MLKAIIFDFDGIILESVDIKGWGFRKLFEQYPQHIDAILSYHYANGGMPRFDKFRHIYQNILKEPLSEKKFQQLCDRYSQLVYDRVVSCHFVAGAEDFLNKYSRFFALFVVSGTPHEEIVRVVADKGLQHFFRGVFGSPQSKVYWTARILEDNGLKGEEVLWVGDALSDLRAAEENGIRFIGRYVPEHDTFKGKNIFLSINDLTDLDQLLSGKAGLSGSLNP